MEATRSKVNIVGSVNTCTVTELQRIVSSSKALGQKEDSLTYLPAYLSWQRE